MNSYSKTKQNKKKLFGLYIYSHTYSMNLPITWFLTAFIQKLFSYISQNKGIFCNSWLLWCDHIKQTLEEVTCFLEEKKKKRENFFFPSFVSRKFVKSFPLIRTTISINLSLVN